MQSPPLSLKNDPLSPWKTEAPFQETISGKIQIPKNVIDACVLLFLSAIWPPHVQFRAITEGATPVNVNDCVCINFSVKGHGEPRNDSLLGSSPHAPPWIDLTPNLSPLTPIWVHYFESLNLVLLGSGVGGGGAFLWNCKFCFGNVSRYKPQDSYFPLNNYEFHNDLF